MHVLYTILGDKMAKVLLIGPRPNGASTGIRIGFESLLDGFDTNGISYLLVDIGRGGETRKPGAFNFKRAILCFMMAMSAWIKIPFVKTVYLTIASSKLGFLRDFLIIVPSSVFRKRIILHLKGGGYGEFYNEQSKFLKAVIKKTLSKATNIIVLGELLRDQFEFVTDSETKIKVIPNGLTKGLMPDIGIGKKLLQNDENIHILYLSNMIKSKGYIDLLEACAKLKQEGFTNFTCNFCGTFIQTVVDDQNCSTEELADSFSNQIKTLELGDQVIYYGRVSGNKKETLLRQAHLFVLPTYYPWEGQPISIIEALAYATPIISTRYKGIPEELIDGYNGYFVEAKNPDDIAEKIKNLLLNPDDYIRMSYNARKHFEENFTR